MILTEIQQKLQAFANPAFRFVPETHEYFLGEQRLQAFSTWIKQVTEPFDELKVAGFSASKRGCTVQEVLDEWQWSRDLGTHTHNLIQGYYEGRTLSDAFNEDTHPDVAARFDKFLALRKLRLDNLTPLGLELQVFSEQYGLCGTIDFLGQHTTTGGLYVLDWKTNATLRMNNGPRYEKMLGPFSDLYATHENKYSLQIAYYRLILETAGIETAGGAIVHLPPGNVPANIVQAIDYRARLRPLLFDFPL